VVFKLRPGTKFHNGRELVAQDFVFSMSRFAHPKTGSTQHFFFDRVAGYAELRSGAAQTLSGVRAVDTKTLEVQLTKPFAEFPAIMAHAAAGTAIPQEEVAKDPAAFALKPVCTGQYLVAEPWVRGSQIKLSLTRGKESIKTIIVQSVADAKTGYKLLEADLVQVADVPVGKLILARKVKGRLSTGANGLISYIGFPVTKPPYDNVELRKALTASTDRKGINRTLLAGSRLVPEGIFPPSSGFRAPCAVFDAKKALAESAVDPSTLKPTVYFNQAGGHEKWLQRVTEDWKKQLGIEATLKPDEWKKYLDFLVQPGADGPFRLAWAVKYPSPEAIVDAVFEAGSPDNFMRYSSPSFEALVTQARATVDDKTRRALYEKAHEVLCNELPMIPMWFGQNNVAFGPGLTAARRLDAFGDPILGALRSP
ncbi:MAG: ABC transporter substrate-binding protein, partial [Actinomycetota bacterium]